MTRLVFLPVCRGGYLPQDSPLCLLGLVERQDVHCVAHGLHLLSGRNEKLIVYIFVYISITVLNFRCHFELLHFLT